jgi:hypothetical protein
MLKVLLYAYVSFVALTLHAQEPGPNRQSPAESVIEDPAKNVYDLQALKTDNGKLQLTWKVSATLPEFFSIERSQDGKLFEVVGVLNKLASDRSFQWTDEAPKKGRSFYRLRYSYEQGISLYSRTITAIVAGALNYKFYPNPVDHILIVRSEWPVDVQISDATGKIRMSHSRVQGIYTINVSSLEKGVYLIRFSNKLTNVMSQEKLIKN